MSEFLAVLDLDRRLDYWSSVMYLAVAMVKDLVLPAPPTKQTESRRK